MSKQNTKLRAQNERLIRMVLQQRFRDGDFDFTEADDIVENYRPEFTDPRDYDQEFTVDAIRAWLIGRDIR